MLNKQYFCESRRNSYLGIKLETVLKINLMIISNHVLPYSITVGVWISTCQWSGNSFSWERWWSRRRGVVFSLACQGLSTEACQSIFVG